MTKFEQFCQEKYKKKSGKQTNHQPNFSMTHWLCVFLHFSGIWTQTGCVNAAETSKRSQNQKSIKKKLFFLGGEMVKKFPTVVKKQQKR